MSNVLEVAKRMSPVHHPSCLTFWIHRWWSPQLASLEQHLLISLGLEPRWGREPTTEEYEGVALI